MPANQGTPVWPGPSSASSLLRALNSLELTFHALVGSTQNSPVSYILLPQSLIEGDELGFFQARPWGFCHLGHDALGLDSISSDL